jgi:hypothetical protein
MQEQLRAREELELFDVVAICLPRVITIRVSQACAEKSRATGDRRRHRCLGQHQALLSALGFECLETLVHVLKVVALPHAAHAGGRDRKSALPQLVGDAQLTEGGLLKIAVRGSCRGLPVAYCCKVPVDPIAHEGLDLIQAIDAMTRALIPPLLF